MFKKFIYIILIVFSLAMFLFTMRGSLGIPSPKEIEFNLSQRGKPFESSQERSRYAIILSLMHDHSFAIDHYASMGTPDIGRIKGHYYSFFPPMTSILAIPLYLLGLKIGATQLLVFLLPTVFSLLTMLLIVRFAMLLKLHWSIALFSAVSFGFATNAWGYSVTLYAHLISAFLILLGLYVVLFVNDKHKALKAWLAWLMYSLAVLVDFPNLFIYLPIVVMAMLKVIDITQLKDKFKIKINWIVICAPLIFVFFMSIYGVYNQVHFGSPFKFSNTIPRVKDLKNVNLAVPESGTGSSEALNTRNLLNGLQSFTVSNDRGILIYSPVVLLFIFGFGFLKSSRKKVEAGLLAVPSTCIVLYSMFGDPYGGWAFGSRYLVAVLPQLCILAGIGLQRFYKNIFVKIIYSIVFIYSAAISLLAPLTTNVIPPYVEARNLNLDSWFIVNLRMLKENELDSFFYNHILQRSITGVAYYMIILSIVILVGLLFIWFKKKAYENV